MRGVIYVAVISLALGALLGLGQVALSGQEPSIQAVGRRAGRRDRVEERLQRMNEQLNLTDEQKAKIRPILQEQMKQLRALRQDTSLAPEQKGEKTRQIRKSAREQIDQILTLEQMAKRAEMRKHAGSRRGAPTQQAPEQQ
jgi:Spy/CpxP family protein refolding chaperone